jgi:hypothetical protein
MTGLTLGYAILICHGHMSHRLLSHECRHVAQYEQVGSIAAFLSAYLGAIVQVGYWNCRSNKIRAHTSYPMPNTYAQGCWHGARIAGTRHEIRSYGVWTLA